MTSFTGVARADRVGPLEGTPPERHKVELRSGRFEVTPQLVFSVNQDFRQFVGGGLVAQYHINDWFGIAGQFAGGTSIDTGLTQNIDSQIGTMPTALQPTQDEFNAHLASINYLLSLYAALTPFAGKLSFFGVAYLHYDAYFMLGMGALGLTNASSPPNGAWGDPTCSGTNPNECPPLNDGLKVGGMLGVGMHLYFNDWLAFDMEARDIVASTNMGGLDVNHDFRVTTDDQSLTNNLFFHFGVTFMLPTTAHISP